MEADAHLCLVAGGVGGFRLVMRPGEVVAVAARAARHLLLAHIVERAVEHRHG